MDTLGTAPISRGHESPKQGGRNRETGVRVRIESFVGVAELVKHNQAECYELGGRLYWYSLFGIPKRSPVTVCA
jgi:hypothetical protein